MTDRRATKLPEIKSDFALMDVKRLPRNIGIRVDVLAKRMTPEQVAELLAIRLANMHPTQCPTHPSHWQDGGIYPPLVRDGLVIGERVTGWSGRGWKRARITELGERVLLSVAEDAMVGAGRMTSLDAPERTDA